MTRPRLPAYRVRATVRSGIEPQYRASLDGAKTLAQRLADRHHLPIAIDHRTETGGVPQEWQPTGLVFID